MFLCCLFVVVVDVCRLLFVGRFVRFICLFVFAVVIVIVVVVAAAAFVLIFFLCQVLRVDC